MTPEQVVAVITGLATLANSLILWPIVRGLKQTQKDHGDRLEKLEAK